MNAITLIARSLRYYWRSHAGTIAGAAVTSTVLVGALVVGDCVRGTLREQALHRVGRVDLSLRSGDRFFRAALADDLQQAFSDSAKTAALIELRAVASTTDSSSRANNVRVFGIDRCFFAMSPSGTVSREPGPEEVILNARLAAHLNADLGDTVLIRVEKPSALPREALLARVDDSTLGLRVRIIAIADESEFGGFSLNSSQLPPMNAFLSRDWLASEIELDGRANMILMKGTRLTVDVANAAIQNVWTLADAELELRTDEQRGYAELRSRRIFIDPVVSHAIDETSYKPTRFLTYFVTGIEAGSRSTPYSMVTAIETGAADLGASELVPDSPNGMVINDWLADDLGASIESELQLRFLIFNDSGELVERTHTFRVERSIPIRNLTADPSLMPDFPGIAEAESSRDWEPGIPFDLSRIRDKDEAYWDVHRGTPKAFIQLAAGQKLWSNRFGDLTSVRVPYGEGESFAQSVLNSIEPRALGLHFEDVRSRTLAASAVANDFGVLFLSLSGFLLIAAILLTVLLFVFNIEQRSREIGTLLAVGYRPRIVRRLLVVEAAILATIGAIIGGALGLGYTYVVLTALSTIWSGATSGASVSLYINPASIAIGIIAAAGASIVATWFAVRFQVRKQSIELLQGASTAFDSQTTLLGSAVRARKGMIFGVILSFGGIALAVTALASNPQQATGLFFGSGSLLLINGILLSRVVLLRLGRAHDVASLGIHSLGTRNAVRRVGRSVATLTLLACGTFLVVAVGMNRLDARAGSPARSSGTGGFAFFATSAVPISRDLTHADARQAYRLDDPLFAEVSFVPLRVRDGDDASCLNLGLAQQPQLLGVDPTQLANRSAFSFVNVIDSADYNEEFLLDGETARPDRSGAARSPWMLLQSHGDSNTRHSSLVIRNSSSPPTIPAIGDHESITWALHKKVGDTIEYIDERGRPFTVEIVATVKNSILQGNLIIDEQYFRELFPAESGYRMFLIDTPPDTPPDTPDSTDRTDTIREELSRRLSDVGMDITPAAARLNDFNAVQNTYLAIFQILGMLGLLLGSAGLGMVVLRNVLERRSELAVLAAIGYRSCDIRSMVLSEHVLLLALGMICGTFSAVVAVIPALRNSGSGATGFATLLTTVTIVALITMGGVFWVWLATRLATRSELIAALRSE